MDLSTSNLTLLLKFSDFNFFGMWLWPGSRWSASLCLNTFTALKKKKKKKKIMFAALQVKCGANVPETKEEIRPLLLLFTAADWKVVLQCMFVGVMAGFHLRVTCQIVGFLFRSFYLSRWWQGLGPVVGGMEVQAVLAEIGNEEYVSPSSYIVTWLMW